MLQTGEGCNVVFQHSTQRWTRVWAHSNSNISKLPPLYGQTDDRGQTYVSHFIHLQEAGLQEGLESGTISGTMAEKNKQIRQEYV